MFTMFGIITRREIITHINFERDRTANKKVVPKQSFCFAPITFQICGIITRRGITRREIIMHIDYECNQMVNKKEVVPGKSYLCSDHVHIFCEIITHCEIITRIHFEHDRTVNKNVVPRKKVCAPTTFKICGIDILREIITHPHFERDQAINKKEVVPPKSFIRSPSTLKNLRNYYST